MEDGRPFDFAQGKLSPVRFAGEGPFDFAQGRSAPH